jgi:hypothetical protein
MRDRRIILKHILKKQVESVWTGFIWFGIATGGGNEPSSSTKGGEFLD